MGFTRYLVMAVCYLGVCTASLEATSNQTISLNRLLEEMVERQALAQFPSPAYTCRQFSSYDRDSVDPNDQSTWFANWDRSQFLRTEERDGRKEFVMMDADGPGAVVRIWATWHGPGGGDFSNGTIRVYIDGSDTPVIEGPAADILDGGGLVGPPLSHGVSPETPYKQRGHNLYLPIPYAHHCKITYSTEVPLDRGGKTGEALYYQINYRTYESGSDVESFSMARLAAAKPTIDAVQRKLYDGQRDDDAAWKTAEWNGELAAGEQQKLFDFDGSGAIRQLRFKIRESDVPQALRSTILKVEFDGQSSIWAPLGDFFGIGYQVRPSRTWYTEVAQDGVLSCAWVMPFESNASISLVNVGDKPVTVALGEAQTSDWNWDDRSMHFHATWKALSKVDTGGEKGRKREMDGVHARDVNYVTVHGKGVYAGDTLTVFNGAPDWWGEGDEKIYVDGEEFPSHFGTGTEDYYGYAWCRPESFSSPFHSQPEGGGNLAGGFSVNNRYRSLDAIPFTESLRFDMELWHWAKTNIDFAPTTFFYARPGATTNVASAPTDAARPVTMNREQICDVFRAPGVLEGEEMKVVAITGGVTQHQDIPMFRWSGDKQLFWIDASEGDELTVEFPVEQAGRYELFTNLTKANDYAIVRIAVNDEPVDANFDRYNPTVSHDEIRLGVFDLQEGANRLKLRVEGSNPAALKKNFVGLDYLKLIPVR